MGVVLDLFPGPGETSQILSGERSIERACRGGAVGLLRTASLIRRPAAWVVALVFAAAMGGQASAAVSGSYTAVPIHDPAGSCIRSTVAINDAGDAVGQAQFPGGQANTSNVHAFYWHADSFLQLPNGVPAGGVFGHGTCLDNDVYRASDLNDAGAIVGVAQFKNPNPGGTIPVDRAALWSPGAAAPTSLGVLPSSCVSSPSSGVSAINAAGDMTGGSTICTSSNQGSLSAFFLPHGGTLDTNGQAIPPGGFAGPNGGALEGDAINSSDQILLNVLPNNSGHPLASYLWSKNGSMPQLPFVAAFSPNVLNDAGVVVGSDSNNLPIYSVNAGVERKLPLPAGMTGGFANGVNSDGDVVGFTFGPSKSFATVWPRAVPPATGTPPAPIDLQTLLPAGSPVLQTGIAITNSGTILAAAGGADGFVVLKGCSAPGAAADAPVGAVQSPSGGGCKLDVGVTPKKPSLTSGLAYDGVEPTFLEGDKCLSGCTNLLITVKDPNNRNKPVRGAVVSATVTPIGDPFLKRPDKGYLCDAAKPTNCGVGRLISGLKTDQNGQVRLLYWAPGLLSRQKTTLNVLARLRTCGKSTCSEKTGGAPPTTISVSPNLIYHPAHAALTLDEADALAAWTEERFSHFVVHKAVEETLNRALAWLAKSEHAAEKLVLKSERIFGVLDLVRLSVDAYRQYKFMALFFRRFNLSGTGLGRPPDQSVVSAAPSPSFINQLAGDGFPLVHLPGFRGLLWRYGEHLAFLEDLNQLHAQSMRLLVYEISDCKQGADCGPGYHGEHGIRPALYFELITSQAPRASFDTAYNARAWMDTQQAFFGKLPVR